MTAILEFDRIDAAYGRAHILHSLSFEVRPGEKVALLGRNGVGKTTTVNTLHGVTAIRSGSIRIRGETVRKCRPYTAARAGIAVVPQGRQVIPELTVKENLLVGAAASKSGNWNLEKVFGLYPVLKERMNAIGTNLSGGQQQMLAIGRALMANPDLLILDEPTEGLAPVIVSELGEALAKVAAEGTAILLIEQDLKLVRRIAERFYVMSKGTIVEEGNIADISRDQLAKHMIV